MAAQATTNEEDIGACTLDQRKLTINKKWRITEKIASGGFGAIYKGRVLLEKEPLVSPLMSSF